MRKTKLVSAKAVPRARAPAHDRAGIADPARVRRSQRTQAERSAATRTRLIEAAITCLHQLGYSATTVAVIAKQAQTSFGAMTHQFPSKIDLMQAVIEEVARSDARHYLSSIAATSAIEWMHDLPAIMWEVMSKPSGIAVMEIMLASRSDPELAEKLRATQEAIHRRGRQFIKKRHAEAGVSERPDEYAVYFMLVAAVRGLALESLVMDNREEAQASIAVLAEAFHLLHPNLPPRPPRGSRRVKS